MKKLPKPLHEYGYPSSQLDLILKELKIDKDLFADSFGVNTCVLDKGELIYYVCDVERALHQLGHKLGKFHLWD